VRRDGKVLFSGPVPRTIAVMLKTLEGCGDPKLIYSAEIEVDLADSK
jgi:hypothetical protein